MKKQEIRKSASENYLFRAVLALLPVAGLVKGLPEGVFWGGLILAVDLTALVFFRLTRPLFPEKAFTAAIVLFLIAAAQTLWYIKDLSPLWIVSPALLLPEDYFRPGSVSGEPAFRRAVIRGAVFSGLLSVYGFVRGAAGDRVIFFQMAAGIFLLLALLFTLQQVELRMRGKA